MSRRAWIAAALLALVLLAAALVWWGGGDAAAWLLRRDAIWARMVETEDLRVGLDPSFPPFEQLNADGAPEGFDVDLARALAARWGLEAKIIPIGFDSLLDALKATQVNAIISAMPYDERQTRDVTYSQPYFEAGIRLVVAAGSPITDVTGLNGARVAVEWGSAGDMIARRLQREQVVALQPVSYETPDDALAAAASGAVDALLIDQVSLRLAQGRGLPLQAVGPVLESNPYVIVTPKRAPTLAAEMRRALDDFAADGTLDALADRWFGAAPTPPASQSPATLRPTPPTEPAEAAP